jgi:hypothetical protein
VEGIEIPDKAVKVDSRPYGGKTQKELKFLIKR